MTTLNSKNNQEFKWSWLISTLEIIFLLVAGFSLTYAVVTAPQNGIDFLTYYKGAREWIEGTYSDGAGSLFTYPPFTIPLISPLAILSFERARILWLGINLLATGISIHLVLSYFNGWPAKAKLYLALLVLSLAPFRVTLRVGQISLIITALVLGTILAHSRGRKYLAGVLLGLSLCKFTLSFPFFLFFLWKKEWKILAAAVLLMLVLTQLYALRFQLSLIKVVSDYVAVMSKLSISPTSAFIGSTEVKPLLDWLTGVDHVWSSILFVTLLASSVIAMVLAFTRRPEAKQTHFAILSLFALWAVYHRTYDSVLYIIPVALLMNCLVHRQHKTFSIFWLASTGLLVLSIPGLLTSRLGVTQETIAQSILMIVAVHLERILTFGMFASLLFLLWKPGSMTIPRVAGRDRSSPDLNMPWNRRSVEGQKGRNEDECLVDENSVLHPRVGRDVSVGERPNGANDGLSSRRRRKYLPLDARSEAAPERAVCV
jgi:hypothetical protein